MFRKVLIIAAALCVGAGVVSPAVSEQIPPNVIRAMEGLKQAVDQQTRIQIVTETAILTTATGRSEFIAVVSFDARITETFALLKGSRLICEYEPVRYMPVVPATCETIYPVSNRSSLVYRVKGQVLSGANDVGLRGAVTQSGFVAVDQATIGTLVIEKVLAVKDLSRNYEWKIR